MAGFYDPITGVYTEVDEATGMPLEQTPVPAPPGPAQQPTAPYQPPAPEASWANPMAMAGETTSAAPAAPPPDRTRPEDKSQYLPGPPRNYIPGSTYIPQDPIPDPRIPYAERVGAEVAFRNTVPGTQGYRRDPKVIATQPYVSPGLGAGSALSPTPLSRYGRELAPRDPERYTPIDPREPQDYQPGSTYVPRYIGMPPIGDSMRQWEPERSSMYFGGSGEDTGRTRPKDNARIDTLTPALGGPETSRRIPTSEGTVLREGNVPPRVYVRSEPGPPQALGSNIGQPIDETFRQMEEARRMRMRPLFMRGLFGGS